MSTDLKIAANLMGPAARRSCQLPQPRLKRKTLHSSPAGHFDVILHMAILKSAHLERQVMSRRAQGSKPVYAFAIRRTADFQGLWKHAYELELWYMRQLHGWQIERGFTGPSLASTSTSPQAVTFVCYGQERTYQWLHPTSAKMQTTHDVVDPSLVLMRRGTS